MPPTYQQIPNLPDNHFQVVYRATDQDDWQDAPGSHSTLEPADAQARDLVGPPHNAFQAMVLGPVVAYQKQD